MFRFLFSALCVAVLAASCLKSEDRGCPYQPTSGNAPQAEQDSVKAYLDSNGLQATKHPTGFYYQIINPGSGSDTMDLCTEIQISYTGRLANDSVFDSQNDVYFVLGQLIEGWKRGIPLIGKGGQMKLYVPPSFGYGSTAQKDKNGKVIIPANSILIFDVRLKDYRLYN